MVTACSSMDTTSSTFISYKEIAEPRMKSISGTGSLMQSDANQHNTKLYNTLKSSITDCKLMKLLEVYYTTNDVVLL